MSIKVTEKQWLDAVRNVYLMAYKGHFTYGDSKSMPPCADKIISCDRLVARACYDLGWKSQPNGGITVVNMETYLTRWGFGKITKQADLKSGDIVLFKWNGQSKPTWKWHTFVITAYNPKTAICSKYDEGSQKRIDSIQPFTNVPLKEWQGSRSFACGFRPPYKTEVHRLPTKGASYIIESALNKSYCADVKSASMDVGANVQIWKKNDSEAQEFCIDDVKDGYVRIVNKKSGLVLDVNSAKVKNGTNIQQYEWNGTKAQLWKMRLNADMTVTFESALDANYVIDVKGGKALNGSNIQLWKHNGTKAQRWMIR